MGNKLNKIFSDKMFEIGGRLCFESDDAYREFLKALETVKAEGKGVQIEGIKSVSAEIHNDGNISYPVFKQTNITDFIVAPAVDTVELKIWVGSEEQKVIFYRYETTKGIVLETNKDKVVYFKIIFYKESEGGKIDYKIQYKYAHNMQEVVNSFSWAGALVSALISPDVHNHSREDEKVIYDLEEHFHSLEEFFRRVKKIEETLGLSFVPERLDDLSNEEIRDLEEMYFLLCENKVIRLNAKITPNETSVIMNPKIKKKLNLGDAISITFLEKMEYTFLGETILLHTANLISDAVVKEVKEDGDSIKVLYGDTDSKPMYISFTAYRSNEEARIEAQRIMTEREKEYKDAKTSYEYMRERDYAEKTD